MSLRNGSLIAVLVLFAVCWALSVPSAAEPSIGGVRGSVRNAETGEAVPGVELWVLKPDGGRTRAMFWITGEDGTFELRMSYSSFRIQIRLAGYKEYISPTLKPGEKEILELDISLVPAKTYFVGSVADYKSGEGIHGAQVSFRGLSGEYEGIAPNGEYKIEVAPGEFWEYRCSKEGYVSYRRGMPKSRDEVRLYGGELHRMNFKLRRLSATIMCKVVSIRKKEAVAGAKVSIVDCNEDLINESRIRWRVSGETDDTGRVKIVAPEGRYAVIVEKEGMRVGALEIETKDDEVSEPQVFLYPRDASLKLAAHDIRTGKGLPNSKIEVVWEGYWGLSIPDPFFGVLDIATENVLLGGSVDLAPGIYRITCKAKGYAAQEFRIYVGSGKKQKLSLPYKSSDFLSSTVNGTVLAPDRIEPFENASIVACDSETIAIRSETVSDREGKFTLEVPPGKLLVTAFWYDLAEGHRYEAGKLVTARRGETHEVKLVMKRVDGPKK